MSVAVVDPAGDVTLSPLAPAPAWADLIGGRLTRSANGYELRVRVGGGAAPERSPDEEHTMNIASFYDLDGDGTVDVEAWANVSSTGWGSAHFDNTNRTGGYQERSGIQVTPEGDEVVLRFPLSHLREASRFRWSVESEWATYAELGSPTSARDAMPDGGAPAAFP